MQSVNVIYNLHNSGFIPWRKVHGGESSYVVAILLFTCPRLAEACPRVTGANDYSLRVKKFYCSIISFLLSGL
jgi:hypothetical protein